jgi:hypothetical protein
MPNQAGVDLAKLLLPADISEFFLITDVIQSKESITIYLEENDTHPIEYKDDKLVSKGFFESITVQDFPLRGKSVFLNIRRRRWTNETTGDIVWRDWEVVAKGTRMTNEFAAFLKVISRYEAGKL